MILIPQLSKGDFSDWQSIAHTFREAASLSLKQAWLGEGGLEEFLPGEVRIGWTDDSILVYARLEDDEIYSDSTADNQKTWNLGDVFELFLRDTSRPDYCELHVNPNSHRLQLRFPSAEHYQTCRDIGPYKVAEPLFDFRVRSLEDSWEVFASIPFQSLNPDVKSPARRTVLASFSRYDASRGKPPVLSSTSAHRVLSFHRQEEWLELSFQ